MAVAAGILGLRPVVVVAVVAAALAELISRDDDLDTRLDVGSLGRLGRLLLRSFAVLATGFGIWTTPAMLPAFGWTASGFLLLNAGLVLLHGYVVHARTPLILTRNAAVTPPVVRPAPPARLTARAVVLLGTLELAVLLPALLAPAAPAVQWLVGGVPVVLLGVLDLWLLLAARAARNTVRGPGFCPRVQTYLDSYRPEVLLYFGGAEESAYQLSMWLTTAEQLPQRTLVLLREPAVFYALPPTSLPVLCVPGSVDLMSLDLESAHVALFTANTGNGLHLIRLPHLMTAFIGHGDSDKSASSSPYAKVYDEIWVAGPAGRERYRRAQVGVRDEDIVLVGRPQVDGILSPGSGPAGAVRTLLYAPTWEGWNTEQAYTSLTAIGPAVVAEALAAGDVRVVYKPHPFTGRRDRSMLRAHRRITAMLEAANASASLAPAGQGLVSGSPTQPEPGGVDAFGGAFARSALSARQCELVREEAAVRFWATRADLAHVVVGEDGPSLFSCFRNADAVVTDVSSVVTDFTATGRPFAVANPTGLSHEQFREMFPAAAAGYLLDPGAGAAEFLAVLRATVPDRLVPARADLRSDLLGDTTRPATERFVLAVESLVQRGRAREAAHTQRGMLRPAAVTADGNHDSDGGGNGSGGR